MFLQMIKGAFIIFMVVTAFILLLLLPREIEITQIGLSSFIAKYPFTFELYKNSIHEFIKHFKLEGLGKTATGIPITIEAQRLLGRSLIIVIPCFVLSMFIGSLLGILNFYLREKTIGKILNFFSWIFSSIPDFFLFIAIQYLLIKLIGAGLPHFNLYGNDNWYSFVIPLLALTLFPMIHIAKFIASSMENEVNQEYVRTSKAKGLTGLQVLIHMLRNCASGLLNQTQVVMLYILSSLPIIEKLSSYHGAGYQLLESIINNEDMQSFVLMLPFLLLMLATIIMAQLIRILLLPKREAV